MPEWKVPAAATEIQWSRLNMGYGVLFYLYGHALLLFMRLCAVPSIQPETGGAIVSVANGYQETLPPSSSSIGE